MGSKMLSFDVRPATRADIPLLAQIEEIASTPPFNRSLWYKVTELTGTPVRTFVEAVLRLDASRLGKVEDYIIVEAHGRPAAACAVFRPADEPGALETDQLPALARALDWDTAATERAVSAYKASVQSESTWLEPIAPVIVETVAVLPEMRGRGVGKILMTAAAERARELGAEELGVMVIIGNDTALALYEAAGFERILTVHAAAFADGFPGVIKLRRRLAPADASAARSPADAASAAGGSQGSA